MQIAGWDIRCPRADPGGLVSNPDPRLWAKEGGGDRWPTHETSGRALGRKESGCRVSVPSRQQKTP